MGGRYPAMPADHIPVTRDEAVEALNLRAGGRYLDGTFGRGGHARAVLAHTDATMREHQSAFIDPPPSLER